MEQDSTNPNQRPSLDEASRVELRMLLLLDWMMAFDQLHAEKQDLEKTLIELQAQVDSLKKGFFKSVEEEDALHDAKNDLKEASFRSFFASCRASSSSTDLKNPFFKESTCACSSISVFSKSCFSACSWSNAIIQSSKSSIRNSTRDASSREGR